MLKGQSACQNTVQVCPPMSNSLHWFSVWRVFLACEHGSRLAQLACLQLCPLANNYCQSTPNDHFPPEWKRRTNAFDYAVLLNTRMFGCNRCTLGLLSVTACKWIEIYYSDGRDEHERHNNVHSTNTVNKVNINNVEYIHISCKIFSCVFGKNRLSSLAKPSLYTVSNRESVCI